MSSSHCVFFGYVNKKCQKNLIFFCLRMLHEMMCWYNGNKYVFLLCLVWFDVFWVLSAQSLARSCWSECLVDQPALFEFSHFLLLF